jgi:hypothetical protein
VAVLVPISYEDVGAFLRFLATEVKVTEQVHVSAIIEKLFSVVDPVHVGAAGSGRGDPGDARAPPRRRGG